MKIIILEACDGFTLIIDRESVGTRVLPNKRYWFSQEDDKAELVQFFKDIGVEAVYEEDY